MEYDESRREGVHEEAMYKHNTTSNLPSRRARFVEVLAWWRVARDCTTMTHTGGALVQLPLFPRAVAEAMQDTGTLQPGSSATLRTTLIFTCHLHPRHNV